jgi:hypothetical protein
MGTEATLALEGRGKIMLYPEPPVAKAQHYGTLGWPKKMRAEYFESMGHSADGRALQPSPRRKPEEIPVERGPQHHEYFIQSLRDGSPAARTPRKANFAAGAAHLANIAYRRGRRMGWDLKTSRVFEA